MTDTAQSPKLITFQDILDGVAVYATSDHVNPTRPSAIVGVPDRCVNFSETPSSTGTQRCLISTVFNDLGMNVDDTENSAYGATFHHRPRFADDTTVDRVAKFTENLQIAADNVGKPIPWSEAIAAMAEEHSALAATLEATR